MVRTQTIRFDYLFMHFLSHYYTELPNNDPYFVTALIIPDLASHFSRAYNSVIKNSVLPLEGNLRQINNGITSHYKGDKRFHNSEPFLQHIELMKQSFLSEGLSRNILRLSVIAHVAVEMMIDRQIILENEAVCNDFYDLLNRADEDILANFFTVNNLVDYGNNFLPKFKVFKERRYLMMFKEIEPIVYGLNRIYCSVTSTEFSEAEKGKFHAALHNIDGTIRYSWKLLLNA